jgi:hypothetical protein
MTISGTARAGRTMLAISVAVAIVTISASLLAAGIGGGRSYHNDALRIRSFETPRKWDPAPQIGYPKVLVLATHPDGAKLLLGAQHVPPGTTAATLAGAAKVTLMKQRFSDLKLTDEDDGRVRLEATSDGGRGLLRQIYLVDGDLAYVVTLHATAGREKKVLRDFDDAVRSLVIEPFASDDGGTVTDGGTGDSGDR